MRPSNLIDRVHDFGENGDIPLSLSIDTSSFQNVYNTINNSYPYAIAHGLSQGPPTLEYFLNGAGLRMPPAIGEPLNVPVENPSNVQVAIKDINPSVNRTFSTVINNPGRWIDSFHFYVFAPIPFAGNMWVRLGSNRPFQTQDVDEFYTYLVFQKSVCVLEDITSTPITIINQQKQISVNDFIKLNKGKSRGKELGSSFVVQYLDNNGNYINAVQNVDYVYVVGNSSTDVVQIKFLQPKTFRIECKVEGYNSATGPYPNGGTGTVTSNNDSVNYTIIVNNLPQADYQDIITLPKIVTNLTIENELSPTTVRRGYSGSFITITGTLDLTGSSYIKKNLTDNTQTTINLTPLQWENEFNARANVSLEILDKSTNSIILSKSGFGPHANLTLPVGNYNFQFKTILK